MTSPEAGLNPARGDDGWAALSALELVARSGGEFAEIGGAEVGQPMALEPCPQELHRIQVRRVRWQKRHLNLAVGGVEVLVYRPGDRLAAAEDTALTLLRKVAPRKSGAPR